MKKNAIVVGAGIVGLAVTRALVLKGYHVEVFDRSAFAVGASIRNFGMIWPIGQTEGKMYERAMLSRSIWKDISADAKIWHNPSGSLHLAYSDLESNVLTAFYESIKSNRSYQIMDGAEILKKYTAVNPIHLKGGLYSPDEMIVDAPIAISSLAKYLQEKYNVGFHWQEHVTEVQTGKLKTTVSAYESDEIYVCTGPDFENLFPEIFESNVITKCKLQMMKTVTQPNEWKLGPSLCGGLSLTHYHSFHAAGASLDLLKKYYADTLPDYIKWGIHVMVSQNSRGELIIGDSHEYGPTHDPFDKHIINAFILDYLRTFAQIPDQRIAATWNGIYSKLKNGSTEIVVSPMEGVTIINGIGGAGMTLSFGLAEQLVNGKYS